MNLSDQFLYLISLLVMLALGFLVSTFFLPPRLRRAMAWSFAPAAGAGICSIIFVLFRRPMFTVEIALLAVLSTVYFLRKGRDEDKMPAARLRKPIVLGLLCLALLLPITYGLLQHADRQPHGGWDAWAIWNSHARVLYRDGANWKKDIGYTVHGDYPLMTPALTARMWRYAGSEATEANAFLCLTFTIAVGAVLVSALSVLRGGMAAFVMGLVLLTTPFFLECGLKQTADVPLSLFVLCTITLMVLYSESAQKEPRLLLFAGFIAGCAGWTKNEGLLFILAVCAGLLMIVAPGLKGARRSFAAFSFGLLPPLFVILLFKFTAAPVNDLIANLHYQEAVRKILSAERHWTIIKSFAAGFWRFGEWKVHPMIPLTAFIALAGVDFRMLRCRHWLACCLILIIVLSGYYLVYLTTSWTLLDHLNSSLARLLIQLWPVFLFTLGLATIRVEMDRNLSETQLQG